MATLVKAKKSEGLATSKTSTTPKNKKVVKLSKAVTDKKVIKDTVEQIVTSKREVKYIYPKDIADDQLAKKKFRVTCRAKDKTFLKEIAVGKGKKEDTAKIEKAYASWRKTVYLVP